MATQPIDTAKLYALTSAGACSVTLTQGEKSITWDALTEGGQTGIIVPAGATLTISDTAALLSPLPANFKAALGAAGKSTGGIGSKSLAGESISPATADEHGSCSVEMSHATWCMLPPSATVCELGANRTAGIALSMTLMLTPAADMPSGWLSAGEAQLLWLYGEPTILNGHTYIIGVTQIAPDKILANLLTVF